MIHDKTIRVGACDWQHPQWQNCFYPDDLPQDWRLSYYANEFSTVLVPQSQWQASWQAEGADFEQWAEDVPEGFRFYFLTADLDVDDSPIKKQLGEAFAGFVPAHGNAEVALINYAEKNLRGWKQWLLEVDFSVVFLMGEDVSVAQLAEFQSLVEVMGL